MEKVVALSSYPKISVIMAAFNASQTVGNTIQNLLEQTYKNLEIIIVNDGSSDATDMVVKSYQKAYKNIKLVSLKHNIGPFRARIEGVDNATGEYIHFIDADDYLSIDFYRTTLMKAIENDSDIVIGSIVLDFKNQGYIRDFPLINDLPFDSLTGSAIFKAFMNQGGLNFTYHMNSTKLYSMKLWKKARPFYDNISKHLIMADDVAMNTPLWFFAQKLDRAPTATLFYVKDDNDSATSNFKISYKKMLKNIDDLFTVFDYFESFLDSQDISDVYHELFMNWKRSFVRVYQRNISDATLTSEEKILLLEHLHGLAPFVENQKWLDTPFFDINTTWRNNLDEVKRKIIQPTTSSVIFSFESLILTTILPDKTEKLHPRTTGLELYNLASFTNKKVLVNSSRISEIKKVLGVNTIESAKDADFGIGSVEVTLPNPLDIFLDRGLDQPFHYAYDAVNPSTMATVIHMIANHYFDNPYISLLDGSAYNGRLSSLGYYSLGLLGVVADKKLAPNDLIRVRQASILEAHPYELYVASNINRGANDFVMSIHNIFDNIPLQNIAHHAEVAMGLAIHTNSWADRQLLRPLLYKYPKIIDMYELSQQHNPSQADHLYNALAGKSRVVKFVSYLLINPGLAVSAAKKHTSRITKKSPILHKALKNTYYKARGMKQRIVKGRND